ncbi:MAG TPA: hypothetical protein VID68_11895 [Solirubrobacteraceae bacterium]
MSKLAAFGRFCWDFVVGDDWRVSVEIVAAVGATAALAAGGVAAWWVLPIAVVAILYGSLRRAVRADGEQS